MKHQFIAGLRPELIGRRDLIAMIGGAAVALPLWARAQQAVLPVVGALTVGNPRGTAALFGKLREGLADIGFVENRDFALQFRWAEGSADALAPNASEFVRQGVAAIYAGGPAAARAAAAATKTIPIVFLMGADPVKLGLVSSINHPGGNITGVDFLVNRLGGKMLGLLHELVPQGKRIGFLVNPTNPSAEDQTHDITVAAAALGLNLAVSKASNDEELATVFAALMSGKYDALVVGSDAFFNVRVGALATSAAKASIPTIAALREFVANGGLMGYGTDMEDANRQVGVYIGRILKGEKPGDLPVMQSTKFELTINLKTAKALGLAVPPTLLDLADKVVE